jgi:hypothetical protein
MDSGLAASRRPGMTVRMPRCREAHLATAAAGNDSMMTIVGNCDQPDLLLLVSASDRRARPVKLPAGQITKIPSSPLCKNISLLA